MKITLTILMAFLFQAIAFADEPPCWCEFNVPENKREKTVSHELWLNSNNKAYEFVKQNESFDFKINTIDKKIHTIDCKSGKLK